MNDYAQRLTNSTHPKAWEMLIVRHARWHPNDQRFHLLRSERPLDPLWIVVGRLWINDDGNFAVSTIVEQDKSS